MGKVRKENNGRLCGIWRPISSTSHFYLQQPYKILVVLDPASFLCVSCDMGQNNTVKLLMILPFPTWIHSFLSSRFKHRLFSIHHFQDRSVKTETQWPPQQLIGCQFQREKMFELLHRFGFQILTALRKWRGNWDIDGNKWTTFPSTFTRG